MVGAAVLQGHMLVSRQSVQKVTKVAKVKGQSTGRTYTSKYRGVHQTFPTKRWEAQFRCAASQPDRTHLQLPCMFRIGTANVRLQQSESCRRWSGVLA